MADPRAASAAPTGAGAGPVPGRGPVPTTAPVAGGGTPQQAATVLVVEDEPAIATAIAQRLSAEGWRVEVARDGLSAVDAATRLRPDAIVLDVMLPGIDGLEVTRRIQAEQPVPILMLTARDDETDMLIGLGVGADDYMTKPFSMRELVARIKALLRRVDRATQAASSAPSDPPMTVGDVTIDKAQRRVYRAGEEVHLTPTEFELLVMLASSPKTVLTRERLLAEVWDWADASGTRTVDSHIKALRRKLGADLIRTVHGVGYAFEPPAG
ncbi:response regulator transcription factor [Cellulosimicrobium cellulans]|jgi:DNA-binding response OmpR family regulator|uniref:response regulator transcription factor n=1 Tax=Cellulosimicrobium TaxID=157920 RepID=UPI001B4C5439|nr:MULTISPECIES: response regulator transcription factor [Actinomycetes]MCR1982348.1 response regulator transcription factor [Cellulosimicrobium cellulans]UTT58334.1 response regulator transcription factor [Cellulosimicrobium cellulans]